MGRSPTLRLTEEEGKTRNTEACMYVKVTEFSFATRVPRRAEET